MPMIRDVGSEGHEARDHLGLPPGWSPYADFTERSPRVMNGG
jgi:hypothetical protein